jgi:GIY-YIG catalytic domain
MDREASGEELQSNQWYKFEGTKLGKALERQGVYFFRPAYPETAKMYVGQTTNLRIRLQYHLRNIRALQESRPWVFKFFFSDRHEELEYVILKGYAPGSCVNERKHGKKAWEEFKREIGYGSS